MRRVKTYSPRKNGQSIVVRETKGAHPCTGREDNTFVSQFLEVIEEIFDVNNYGVLGEKIRELPLFLGGRSNTSKEGVKLQ